MSVDAGGDAGFDAILVCSYGGPRRPEDVLPFMRNATRGRGIPDERLLEVSQHYQRFGGASPINERNAELIEALRAELARRGVRVPIVVGNRNWTPYFRDAFVELDRMGAQRVLCLVTAAYASYSGCRQYREDLAAATEATGLSFDLTKVGPYAETDGFVRANADAVRAALDELAAEDHDSPAPRVLFVTHSIPAAMDRASGPAPGHTYREQHLRVVGRVAAELGLPDGAWELVYCSRSGAPHIPWLEPDVNDRLEELAAAGVRRVVAAPVGFINDHMEVVYDLDTEARATASELGLRYVRAATAGVHPAFVAMLADAVEAAEPGQVGGIPTCHATCCLVGRPGAKPVPAACGNDQPTEETHDPRSAREGARRPVQR